MACLPSQMMQLQKALALFRLDCARGAIRKRWDSYLGQAFDFQVAA